MGPLKFRESFQENSVKSPFDELTAHEVAKGKEEEVATRRFSAPQKEGKSLSGRQLREALIQEGIVPNKQGAEKRFWALGEDWWRQIIDGRFQKHGEEVFDKGLHGKGEEPGFMKGVRAGAEKCVGALDEDFSLNQYRQIHHVACEHFRGADNNTQFTSRQLDTFRAKMQKSFIDLMPEKAREIQLLHDDLSRAISVFMTLPRPRPCHPYYGRGHRRKT